MLSSKNQLYGPSVAFSELRVAFHLHVELLQFRSSSFTTIVLFHTGPVYFKMLRPTKKRPLLRHEKFIFLSFELKFGIFFCCFYETYKKGVGQL